MQNPHATLGIPSTSSLNEARAAYRRAAQKHHPDKGGDAEVFKTMKAAFEAIETGQYSTSSPTARTSASQPRPSQQKWSKPEAAFERREVRPGELYDPYLHYPPTNASPFKAPQRAKPSWAPTIVEGYAEPALKKASLGHFIARVSIAEAFKGFTVECMIDGAVHSFKMPPGIPSGLRLEMPYKHGTVGISTLFTQSAYRFSTYDTALRESTIVNSAPDQVLRTKDLALTLEIKVRNGYLKSSCTLKHTDLTGEELRIVVPVNHDLRTPILVQGKGYYDWYIQNQGSGGTRGNLYVHLRPTEEMGEGSFN